MKFSHKLAKLGQPLTYRRAWRRAERLIHPIPLEPIYRRIDPVKLAAIQARYAGSKEHYAKYADVRRWLRPDDVQPQPAPDIGVFRIVLFRSGVPRLDRHQFDRVDSTIDRLEWDRMNEPLGSTPGAPIRQRLAQFRELVGKLHPQGRIAQSAIAPCQNRFARKTRCCLTAAPLVSAAIATSTAVTAAAATVAAAATAVAAAATAAIPTAATTTAGRTRFA